MIAAPSPAARDWNFIVLKVDGHGLAADIQKSLDTLDRVGTTPAAYVTVRAEQNHAITDYALTDASGAHHLVPAAGGTVKHDTRRDPVLSADCMKQFLLNTMQHYPAKHYLVSFDGHSHALRQAIGPMHEALAAAMQASGRKIDVLVLDACFMAQIEAAAEFQDVADVLVGSQESMEGSRPVEKLAQEVAAHPMTAQEVGISLVAQSQESTLSAMDLAKTPDVEGTMRAFATAVGQVADAQTLRQVRLEVDSAQHFYTQGWSNPHPFHNTVDVCDFATRVGLDPLVASRAPALAQASLDLAGGLGGLVIADKHTQTVKHSPTLDVVDVRRAHGLSVFLPTTAPILRDQYTHFKNSRFDHDTGWDAAVDHLTEARSVGDVVDSAKENESGLAWAAVELTLTKIKESADAVADWVKKHHRK